MSACPPRVPLPAARGPRGRGRAGRAARGAAPGPRPGPRPAAGYRRRVFASVRPRGTRAGVRARRAHAGGTGVCVQRQVRHVRCRRPVYTARVPPARADACARTGACGSCRCPRPGGSSTAASRSRPRGADDGTRRGRDRAVARGCRVPSSAPRSCLLGVMRVGSRLLRGALPPAAPGGARGSSPLSVRALYGSRGIPRETPLVTFYSLHLLFPRASYTWGDHRRRRRRHPFRARQKLRSALRGRHSRVLHTSGLWHGTAAWAVLL